MPFDFPNTPVLDDVFLSPGGPSYKWNGVAWVKVPTAVAEGGASIEVSDTLPVAPEDNALWWESDSGALFLYFNDGSGAQWVQVNAASTIPTPPSDNNEYVMVNGVWRLKEQSFDIAGLTQQDLFVPALAKAVHIEGSVYTLAVTNVVQMRVSGDGSIFFSGATDYVDGGGSHNSGTATYQTSSVVAASAMNIAVSHDSAAFPINITADGNVVRPSTAAQNFLFKSYSKAYFAGASNLYRTWWGVGLPTTALTGTLRLAALRIFLSSGGAFQPGSFLNVRWSY